MSGEGEGYNEENVDQHFQNMNKHKRRRLSRKLAPPQTPQYKLKHHAAARGISSGALLRMLKCGLPLILINAFVFLQTVSPMAPEDRLDAVDFYAGEGRIAESFIEVERAAAEFDILRHFLHENILTPEGLLTALKLVRNSARGFNAYGTLCSSWVYPVFAKTVWFFELIILSIVLELLIYRRR